MGFITARLTPLTESDPKDRALLGLGGAGADRQRAVYILTLGTLPALRQQARGFHSPVGALDWAYDRRPRTVISCPRLRSCKARALTPNSCLKPAKGQCALC